MKVKPPVTTVLGKHSNRAPPVSTAVIPITTIYDTRFASIRIAPHAV